MVNKFKKPFARQLSIAIRIFLILSVAVPSSSQATGVQATSCTNNHLGATKQIYVEYLDSKYKARRTIYSTGGAKNKTIAWAQTNPQICNQVASNLVSKLISGGWNCNNANKVRKPDYKTQTKIDLPLPAMRTIF